MNAVNYIAHFLASKGIDTVFQLQGGMITRIIDALHTHGGFNIVSVHHEQAAAMAADAWARVKNKPGVALATSGPGATNLLTGIGNCFFDSVPALFITGQVNLNEQKGERSIRQLGFQETDIVSLVKPITKAAYAVTAAKDLPRILEEAYNLSLAGRPGPVLIDLPMNIQKEDCQPYVETTHTGNTLTSPADSAHFIELFRAARQAAQRPLLLLGRGVRAAGVTSAVRQLVDLLDIPVVLSLNGLDVLPYQHPKRVGFIGSYGNRWANYALGTSDLLLVLGSRLDLRQTGSDIPNFANGKKIFHIDIDAGELNNRIPTTAALQADLNHVVPILLKADLKGPTINNWEQSINTQKLRKDDTNELTAIRGINPNRFIHQLSQQSWQAGAYTTDVGNNQMWAAQSIELTDKQVFLSSGGMGAMGYSLPAAIGACFAQGHKPVVSLSGDGGFQINIQELQTIKRNLLPIKMVVLNNHCLGMIRQFQDSYFNSQYAATVWGYSAPDFVAVAQAFGIKAERVDADDQVEDALAKLWENPQEPFLLDVSIDIHTNVYPKMLFGNPLTEMEGESNE